MLVCDARLPASPAFQDGHLKWSAFQVTVRDQADQSCVITSWDLCGRQPPGGQDLSVYTLVFSLESTEDKN